MSDIEHKHTVCVTRTAADKSVKVAQYTEVLENGIILEVWAETAPENDRTQTTST